MSASQLVFTPGAGKGMVHAGVDENLGVRSARQRAHNRLTRGRRAKLVVFRDVQHRVRGGLRFPIHFGGVPIGCGILGVVAWSVQIGSVDSTQ